MRLQFPLKKVKISPVCHIQLNRHAQQFRGRYAIGQLYGALYDDEAHVTNILPYPDAESMSRQELQAMERRHEDLTNKFGLDNTYIGWYLVSYRQNVWEQLQNAKYYEKILNTSFMLVYDYQARLMGRSPYQALRLTDEFALKEEFSYRDIKFTEDNKMQNPYTEVPVEVEKDELFEYLMLVNKKKILKNLTSNKALSKQNNNVLNLNIENYLSTLEQQTQTNKKILQKQNTKEEKKISFNEYCENLGVLLKAEKQEQILRNYEKNIEGSKILFQEL